MIFGMERSIKLLRDKESQFIEIPSEFVLPGEDAIIRKEGNKLIIERTPKRSLLELLVTLEPLDEDFPEIENLPPEPFDL
jgi:antitoxin VapB